MTGARDVTFNLANFYHNERRLIGVDTSKLDIIACAGLVELMRPGFGTGDHQPSSVSRRFPMSKALAADQAVAEGEQGG